MIKKYLICVISFIIVLSGSNLPQIYPLEEKNALDSPDGYEKEIANFKPNPAFPDDAVVIVALKEAVAARREGNGPIGACLIREIDGKILETGHNRQNFPYFRSDMHAEMDMLTRYENRIKMQRIANGKAINPRIMYKGLVLYSSLEPCLMCLTRIINAGIPKVYYAASDDPRGVANNTQCLPAYWKDILEKNMKYGSAKCSPRLKEIASALFAKARKNAEKKPAE